MTTRQWRFSQSALNYTWRQLAQRVGILLREDAQTGFEDLGLKIHYGSPDQFEGPGLVVCRCEDSAWSELLDAKENCLHWKPAMETVPDGVQLPFQNEIPILFWGKGFDDGHHPFAERRADGSVVFYVDILAAAFFMLSRWEETVIPDRDVHGRSFSTSSVAARQGFLDIPIIDQYTRIVSEWIKLMLPGFEAQYPRMRVKPTHDVDTILRFPTVRAFVRSMGHAVLRKRDPQRVFSHLRDLSTQLITPEQDLYQRTLVELAELSEQHGFKSSFYFMATDGNQYQQGYDYSSAGMRRTFKRLLDGGHEIGLHPGYFTFKDRARLLKEKRDFESVLGLPVTGGRQHYLRFQAPVTWRDWEQAGFLYDSSVGYADCEGFRCGTCWPFHPFDLEEDRELRLEEFPLIVMDGTLLHYRQLSPEQGREKMLSLAQRCAEVGGVFTILWHNSSVGDDWTPWFNEYKAVLSKLEELI